MFAKPLERDRGTTFVLLETMNAAATIEAINGEQIATRTDLLLMRARDARVRLSSNKLAFANDVRHAEHTMFIRVRRVGTSTATAAILAAVFATAILITSFI